MLSFTSRAVQRGAVRPLARGLSARFMSSTAPSVPLFINGEFVESKSTKFIDLHNPATNEVIGRVPEATEEEMKAATAAAKAAFPAWRDTPVQQRMRIMLKYQALIREHHEELAGLVTLEQGKTTLDAWGDVFRGLEVSVPHNTASLCRHVVLPLFVIFLLLCRSLSTVLPSLP